MKYVTALFALLFVAGLPAAHAQLLGPIGGSGADGEYNQAADSPFFLLDFSTGYFYLENFEEDFDVPGVTTDQGNKVSINYGPNQHDSVDSDDGVVDGNGLDGDNWYYDTGSIGVTWTFDATVLPALPTHAGIVWTDGEGDIVFEAFDAEGNSLGTVTGMHACCGTSGTTADDRFYGVIDAGGISAIKISNAGGGIELDHLQYGRMDISNVAIETPGSGRSDGTALHQNYPEPFHGRTTLAFDLPDQAPVRVEVINVLGQVVQVPFDGWAYRGATTVPVDLSALPGGIYIYRMTTPSGVFTRQMVNAR
ncbi:MAG: T9SS type A sorting domain-containing protein [Rhodothermales bacterium]